MLFAPQDPAGFWADEAAEYHWANKVRPAALRAFRGAVLLNTESAALLGGREGGASALDHGAAETKNNPHHR
jgi:hypothetical protein